MSDEPQGRRMPAERGAAGRGAALEVTAIRGERDFRKARRHGSMVRALIVILPIVVVVAAGAFVATAVLAPRGGGIASLGEVDITSNSLVMTTPHISGFSGMKESYELSATRAIQSLENPKLVTLENIDAQLGLGTADKAKLGATRGLYDGNAETLKLTDGIVVTTASGMEARLDAADVDLKNGKLTADTPMQLRSADGTIQGNAVEITDGGKRIMFTKGVSVTLTPQPAAEK